MYSVSKPFSENMLDVGNGHHIYMAQFGNPEGIPIVYLHGGPGAGMSLGVLNYFDSDKFHVVMFDQRGCGKSIPLASTDHNTISDLVDDMEKIRCSIGLEKWYVAGGSWGSALAMFYTKKYQDKVSGIILRGVFFATKEGARHIAEETTQRSKTDRYFEKYRDLIPEDQRSSGLISAYNTIMQGDDESIKLEAAKRFMQWDASIAFYDNADAKKVVEEIGSNPTTEIPITKIFMSFAVNEFDDALKKHLLNCDALKKTKIWVIHGENDLICPVQNAYDLKKAYPETDMIICPKSGHAGSEPEIVRQHISIFDGIKCF